MAEQSLANLYSTKSDKGHTHAGTEITSAVANATNATNASYVPFTGVTSKPTTLSGYGITDGVNSADVVTTATANKILKLNASGLLPASITGNAATATTATTATSCTGNSATVGGLAGSQLLRNDIGNQTINGANNTSILNLVSPSGKLQFYCYSDGINYIESFNGSGGSAPIHLGGAGDTDTTINMKGTVNVTGTLTVPGIASTVQSNFQGNQTTGIGTGTGSLGGIMVQGNGSGAAFMSFHRPGSYAVYFGLDTDNQLALGGWSAGATRRVVAFTDSTVNAALNIPTSDQGGNIWIG